MTTLAIGYVFGGLAFILAGDYGHRRGWWGYAFYFFFFSAVGVFLIGLASASYFFPELIFRDHFIRSLGYTIFSLFTLRIFWVRRIESENKAKKG